MQSLPPLQRVTVFVYCIFSAPPFLQRCVLGSPLPYTPLRTSVRPQTAWWELRPHR